MLKKIILALILASVVMSFSLSKEKKTNLAPYNPKNS